MAVWEVSFEVYDSEGWEEKQQGGVYTTTLLNENEEILFLWSSVLARLHSSENARLTREVCVTINESTWN